MDQRLSACERRIDEMAAQLERARRGIDRLQIQGEFVIGEGEDVTRRFFACQEDFCTVNSGLNRLLEAMNTIPDDQWSVSTVNDMKRFVADIAQFTDQVCQDLTQLRRQRGQRNRQMQLLAQAQVRAVRMQRATAPGDEEE